MNFHVVKDKILITVHYKLVFGYQQMAKLECIIFAIYCMQLNAFLAESVNYFEVLVILASARYPNLPNFCLLLKICRKKCNCVKHGQILKTWTAAKKIQLKFWILQEFY